VYLCILDAHGQVLVHKNRKTGPDERMNAIAPFQNDPVIGVKCCSHGIGYQISVKITRLPLERFFATHAAAA